MVKTVKMSIIVCTALMITGCTLPQIPLPELQRNVSVLQIKVVDDVHDSCNEGAATNYLRIVARYQSCARWTPNKTLKSTGREYNTCEITVGRSVNLEVLGHEVLHCFVGNFHGGDSRRSELAVR